MPNLIHTLVIERPVSQLDGIGQPELDEYGQPARAYVDLATINGLPQPKSAKEAALVSQAGAELTDYTIYTLLTDLESADRIRHDQDTCNVPDAIDLPDSVFELSGAPRNAGGAGHHLEIDARLVRSPEPAVEIASGS